MNSEGTAAWRTETASRAAVVVDADSYFRLARSAMLNAKSRIMLVGWDFDARIRLVDPAERLPGEPGTLGGFITWLIARNPTLEINLLRWDTGAIKTLFRGYTIFTLMKWMAHPRIHTKLDGYHPLGASHHQKIVVIDDCFAFCGGIDMTADRWDTRAHRDDEPGRRRPSGRAYKPWHDATMAVEGPVARALGELCRDRWVKAGGAPIAMPPGDPCDCWPQGLVPHFTDVPLTIARSHGEMPDGPPIREVEAQFLDQIARVRRHLYIESQYFASRRIAEAIARRLDEPDGPEIVIVNPETAQGWLEPLAMDTARARLMEALGRRDRHDRLRIYHPYTAGGAPIYCHAKILIADDKLLRVGSSNMNNRSLRLDTECDLILRAEDAGECATIRAIRDDLLAEHLDRPVADVAAAIDAHGLIGAVEALRGAGRTLKPYRPPELSDTETWLADNEVLDPEGPDEMFEAFTKRGLFRRLRRPPR